MQPNRNLISRILFWIGIFIIALGFVSGFAAGSNAAEVEQGSGIDFSVALSVWVSTMIPGVLIIGFAEVIRLLQDVRDVVMRSRRGRTLNFLAENKDAYPMPEGSAAVKPPLFEQEAGQMFSEMDLPKPFPRLSKDNLFHEGEKALRFHRLIKRINALEFYLEVEDPITLEEKLGDVKRFYFEVKHLVFTAGLEHDPIWLNVMDTVRFIEVELARLKKQYPRSGEAVR